jgi:hypothetical protein
MEERLETLARQSGNRNGLLHNPVVDDLSKRDEYIALLKKYGIEV